MNSIAIYTTFCGIKELATFNSTLITSTIPHYFISNNIDIIKKVNDIGWTPIYLNQPVSSDIAKSSEQAKIAKAMPQVFCELTQYRWLIYKDDKIDFDYTKINSYINALLAKDYFLGLRSYPAHVNFPNNILYEFAEAMLQQRYYYQRDRIINYITNQIQLGKQLTSQLYWTSFIIRDQQHQLTNKFNCDWFDSIQLCGAECQISFDFVSQDYSNKIFILPQNI
jgi:hypothetical protein